MFNPLDFLTEDMGPRSIVMLIVSVGALLMLALMAFEFASAFVGVMVTTVDPGAASFGAEFRVPATGGSPG